MTDAYALRPATEQDFDFLFALHRAAMRGYYERLGLRIVGEEEARYHMAG